MVSLESTGTARGCRGRLPQVDSLAPGIHLLLAWVFTAGCGTVYTHQWAGDGGQGDATTTPQAECGNGVVEPGEACDGTDFAGRTCGDLGYSEGTLACRPGCTLDTAGCIPRCGNGRIDPGEDCDGTDTGGHTCQTFGLFPGTLICRSDCTFDLTHCPGCGNGVKEPGEDCDGQDLGGLACEGALTCSEACLVDATACALSAAGDGSDGPLVVSEDMTLAAPESAAYSVKALGVDVVTVTEPALALSPGNEVLLVNLQGDAESCQAAGVHERAWVASVTNDEVHLTQPISRIYGAGGKNDDLAGQRIVLQRVPHFSSVHILPGASLRPSPWDGTSGGLLVFRVAGLLRVDAGGLLTAHGAGYRGGLGWTSRGTTHGRPGESYCGWPQDPSDVPNFGGGGGGRYQDTEDDCGQGGGGGGYGTVGAWESFGQTCIEHGSTTPAQNGGETYGSPNLSPLLPGSGGGAGATDDHSNTSGTGGFGGGILWITAHAVELQGTISARGLSGTVPTDPTDSGNGGGGSGGAIRLEAGSLSGTGVVDARGGLRTPATTEWNNAGAAGGMGRIRLALRTAGGYLHGSPGAGDWLGLHVSPSPGHVSLLLD